MEEQMATSLKGKKIAFLATDGFEQAELFEPRKALDEAGATTVVVSPKSGEIKAWNMKDWGKTVKVDKLLDEQYQGPNPYITLYVMVIATNGYQTLVSESEIDPQYGNTPVLVSLVEDGVPMTQAPYANTSKAPAQLVVPSDQRGGRYANRICRIVVMNGAVGPEAAQQPDSAGVSHIQ